MLASDADRDRILALLREAYASGRITHDELSTRVTSTLSARTVEQLDSVVADLAPPRVPSPLAQPYPQPYPYWSRRHQRHPAHYHARPRWIWAPFVIAGSFFWLPSLFGVRFFFFPFLFFGGWCLFALCRRSLRF
jgi:hypothetical protein